MVLKIPLGQRVWLFNSKHFVWLLSFHHASVVKFQMRIELLLAAIILPKSPHLADVLPTGQEEHLLIFPP